MRKNSSGTTTAVSTGKPFHTPVAKKQIMAVLKMGRFLVLLAGVAAYLLGLAYTFYETGFVDWLRAGLGFLLMCLGTLSAHYADEYADVDTDSITRRTMFSGGSGVLPSGIVPPIWALRSAIVCMGLAIGLAACWVAIGIFQPVVLIMVFIAIVGGWFYSMPPLMLERRGLGEIDNAILGGWFMTLMAYAAQTGSMDTMSLLRFVPVVLIVYVNLLGVHWPDRTADETAGKSSIVVLLKEKTAVVHAILIALTYIYLIGFSGALYPPQVTFAALLTLPVGIVTAVRFFRKPGPFLSSLLMMVLMAAMAIGWVAAAY
jgi:1,4-dihydroxy-2-naphthoate polyprenyltransferase